MSACNLVVQLDALEDEVDTPERFTQGKLKLFDKDNNDRILNDALRNAIYAYAARWLPLQDTFRRTESDVERASKQAQDFRDQLWQRARRSISATMSRPSYRSILALYLFSLTEMPLINDHPGSGQLCTQVLLTHFGILRSPLRWSKTRPLSLSTTVLPTVQTSQRDLALCGKRHVADEGQQRMRDAMFWVGVVCDTSRSLINQVPMVLLGEHGDAKVWEFILQRTVIFDQSFRSLHGSQGPLSPDLINVILEHATACKTMYLGIINQFCDALLHRDTEAIEKGAERIRLESRRFREIFDPLLSMCGNEYLTLSPESQLNYGKCTCPAY